MTITINLIAVPFVESAHIKSVNSQYIKLDPKKRTLKFFVQCEGRNRIVLDVCKFMVKTINSNPTRFIDSSIIKPTLKSWFDKVCLHSFRSYADESQSLFEDMAMGEGRSLVLEALGLTQPDDIACEESPAPTPPEELVAVESCEEVEQITIVSKFQLPIGNGRQVELIVPSDLTTDEADLIAEASLEYFKHLILTQFKK